MKLEAFFNLLFEDKSLDFWMIEIIIIYFLNIKIFKLKTYIHQKIAFGIVLIFSTLMKIISIIFAFRDGEEIDFINPALFIFIGIIGYLLIYSTEGYIFCKLKYYFEYKFISEIKILIVSGIFGFSIFLFCSLFTNFIECPSNELSDKICEASENDSNSPKYFDNYEIFFKNIWRKDRTSIINCIYAFLFLLKLSFSIFENLFTFLIIKVLDPMYLLASYSIIAFIVHIIYSIHVMVTNENKIEISSIFDIFESFFTILGSIIYLELIELNFCGLNYYLKKNIELRAKIENLDSPINKDEEINEIVDVDTEICMELDSMVGEKN